MRAFLMLVAVLILGSVAVVKAQDIVPTPVPTEIQSVSVPAEFQQGISVVLYGNDTTMAINTVGFFDDLEKRNLNVKSLIFTFPIYQDGLNSVELYADTDQTPTPENVRIFIQEAHKRGYSVWIKPLIDDGRLGTGHWRGGITPGGDLSNEDYLNQWFASYLNLLIPYVLVAEQEHAMGFVIGTELESLDKDMEKYTVRWTFLIDTFRSIFHGLISYGMNWSPQQLPGFASELDVLMIDAFYDNQDLPNNASADAIYLSWKRNWLPLLKQYQDTLGIPIMFSEVGVVPRVGSYRTPWNGNNGNGADYQAQARYYEATCRFAREIGIRGVYWWAVGFYDQFENQTGRLTYNFYDLPAQEKVQECYKDPVLD